MALKRFAWLGGAAGSMMLAVFGAYAWRTQDVALSTQWLSLGGAGLLLVVLWLWLDRAHISDFSRSRSAKQSGFALTLTAIGLAIAISANMLATKHDTRWDLTSSERYALSDQTVSVAQGLTEKVEVLTFFVGEQPELSAFKDLLGGVLAHTQQLQISHHDPVLSPQLADRYTIVSGSGTVVLQQGEREQRLEGRFDEQALVNALIRLSSPTEHQVCVVLGHGEMEPDGPHLSGIVILLERQNYTFSTVNLMTQGGVPPTCAVVIIADPEDEWLAPEREMLAAYLAGGGQVIALLNPTRVDGLAADLTRYGIAVGEDVLYEAHPERMVPNSDASVLVLPSMAMADHPVTAPIRSMAVMPVARSVSIVEPAPEGMHTRELIHTSEYAWAETDFSAPPAPDPAVDRIGNIPVLSLAEITDPERLAVGPRTLNAQAGAVEPAISRNAGGRLLVFGDADFTTNEVLGMGSNLDLLQNAIAWMVGEDDQVSIRPNEAAQSTLTMSPIQELLLWLLMGLVLPGVCISAAVSTWLTRRRR